MSHLDHTLILFRRELQLQPQNGLGEGATEARACNEWMMQPSTLMDGARDKSHMMSAVEATRVLVQGSAKRWSPGCVNGAGEAWH